MLFSLFIAFWYLLPISFLSCVILFLCSPFSIAITSIGEEGAHLSAFCTFVRFALVLVLSVPLLGRAVACKIRQSSFKS